MSTRKSSTPKMPQLLTAEEVVNVVRLDHVDPANALYRLRKSGRLIGVKIGRSYKYTRDSVLRLINSANA